MNIDNYGAKQLAKSKVQNKMMRKNQTSDKDLEDRIGTKEFKRHQEHLKRKKLQDNTALFLANQNRRKNYDTES